MNASGAYKGYFLLFLCALEGCDDSPSRRCFVLIVCLFCLRYCEVLRCWCAKESFLSTLSRLSKVWRLKLGHGTTLRITGFHRKRFGLRDSPTSKNADGELNGEFLQIEAPKNCWDQAKFKEKWLDYRR